MMLETPEPLTQTQAQRHGVMGKSAAKLFNYLADGRARTVNELHAATDVNLMTIPSFLRYLRQRGFVVVCKRNNNQSYYNLVLPAEQNDGIAQQA